VPLQFSRTEAGAIPGLNWRNRNAEMGTDLLRDRHHRGAARLHERGGCDLRDSEVPGWPVPRALRGVLDPRSNGGPTRGVVGGYEAGVFPRPRSSKPVAVAQSGRP
jgi:hypothetical protein